MKVTPKNVELFNQNIRYEQPNAIIEFALELSNNPIVTTSFGAHSSAMLHAITSIDTDIKVVWCDTGYNTKETYEHVAELSKKLQLNLKIYTPKYTTAYIDAIIGGPKSNNYGHQRFSEIVKLEPFRRALNTYHPDVWFTNIRKGQTAYRDHLDILSFSNDGVLKVSPFYYFTDEEIRNYIQKNGLPILSNYLDPVKQSSHRECGIHL